MMCFFRKKTYPLFPYCDPADIYKMTSIKDKYLQFQYILKTDEKYQKLFYERLRTLNRFHQSNTYYLNCCKTHIDEKRKEIMDNNINILLEEFDEEQDGIKMKVYYENPCFNPEI
jgi:hypothetical protein